MEGLLGDEQRLEQLMPIQTQLDHSAIRRSTYVTPVNLL
jgi:hypothetical protein